MSFCFLSCLLPAERVNWHMGQKFLLGALMPWSRLQVTHLLLEDQTQSPQKGDGHRNTASWGWKGLAPLTPHGSGLSLS